MNNTDNDSGYGSNQDLKERSQKQSKQKQKKSKVIKARCKEIALELLAVFCM